MKLIRCEKTIIRRPKKPDLQVIEGGKKTLWDFLTPEERAELQMEHVREVEDMERILREHALFYKPIRPRIPVSSDDPDDLIPF